MKEGTESKLKFKKLKRRLGLPEWQVIGLLESIWRLCRKDAQEGNIGRFSNEDIAAAIEYDDDPDELVQALVACEWLDEDPDPEVRLIVHNWSEHVPSYLKGNFAKHKRTFADQAAKQRTQQAAEQSAISTVLPSQAKPSPTKSSQTLFSSVAESDGQTDQITEVVEAWNATAGIPSVRKLTKDRRAKLRTRLKDPEWPWRECLAKLPLPGKPGQWQPNFDWFVENETNVHKVLDGKYDWRNGDQKIGAGQTYDANTEFGSGF